MKNYLPAIIILGMVLVLVLPRGYCQSEYLYLYPTKGTVFTNIVLKAFVPVGSNSWVYWDDVVIAENLPYDDQIQGFALNFTCPNEHPYSDLGNHTVTVEAHYWDNSSQLAYFNATFEIVEYFPSAEYLALNATYHALLTNFSDLLYNYSSLLANYSALSSDHNSLLNDYNTLLSNYNSLSANYNSFFANYNALSSNYNSLSADYGNLRALYSLFLANYSSLLGSYESLNTNYNTLRENFNSLNSSYGGLAENYSALLNELALARVLSYVFIATTIALAVVTVYFITRRFKLISKAR